MRRGNLTGIEASSARAVAILATVTLLTFSGCGGGAQPQSPDPAGASQEEEQFMGYTGEEAALLRDVYEIVDAFNQQDLDRLMSLHHPDVVYMVPSQPSIKGRDAVRAMYDEIFTRFRENKRYRYIQPGTDREIVVMGDWAWMRGGSYSVMSPIGETPVFDLDVEINAKTVGIYKKENGHWLRYIQIRNGNTPDMNI